MRKRTLALLAGTALMAGAQTAAAADRAAVLTTYADIAEAMYADALITARVLDAAIDKLIAEPSAGTFAAARQAWLAARVPYQQTEVYRFGNVIVDEWEGRVNAWPLDEGLIDYVDASYGTVSDVNAFYSVNVIASPSLSIGGQAIDASRIDIDFIESLHEIDEVEANVSIGYHAIEFLLWGQDLNGTGPGAGQRPWTDYSLSDCTGGNCDRRQAYLAAASDLLVQDLEWMAAQWVDGGAARAALFEDEDAGIATIITGLGSLSYGELAGERTKLGLMLHDPEEEHDCFADNTHNSHYYNQVGMRAVYEGGYRRIDGTRVGGAGLSYLIAEADPALDAAIRAAMEDASQAMAAMKLRAETVERYDQMIGPGNAEGNATIQAVVDTLVAQARAIEPAIAALGLEAIDFEGSDSLDNPSAVQ